MLIDEASFGYNAYSVLHTGKDEHGVSYPLIFQAFGDQKLPVYAYSLIPFIWLFDLSTTVVRIPSVLAGTFITVCMFFLVRALGFSRPLGLLASLIVAVSPWNIILSRFGYESNIGLLFFSLGLLSIFLYLRQKRLYWLIAAGITFGLTWYSYLAYRLAVPLIIVTLLILLVRSKQITLQKSGVFVVTFLLIVLPLIPTLFAKEGTARFNQISLFSEAGITMEINENRALCTQDWPKILCYGLYNKPVLLSKTLIERSIRIFSPEYLFTTGEVDLHLISIKHFGLFPALLLPFFFLGLFSLISKTRQKNTSPIEPFILICLPLSILPSLIAGDPQRVRLTPLFPFMILVFAYGFEFAGSLLHDRFHRLIAYVSVGILLLICGSTFMISYLSVHTKKYEIEYLSHIPRLVSSLSSYPQNTEIYISDFGYALYYYIYYTKPSPRDVQTSAVWEKPGSSGISHITDYKSIHRTEKNVSDIFCFDSKGKSSAVYVTAHNLASLKPLQIIKTTDSVFTLFYIYDIPSNRPIICGK